MFGLEGGQTSFLFLNYLLFAKDTLLLAQAFLFLPLPSLFLFLLDPLHASFFFELNLVETLLFLLFQPHLSLRLLLFKQEP